MILIMAMFPYLFVRYTDAEWFRRQKHITEDISGRNISQRLEYECILRLMSLPVSCPREALKAQAILIRTNLLCESEKESVRDQAGDDLESGAKQVAGKDTVRLAGRYRFFKEIVEETKGKILTCEGRAVPVPYCYLSAGMTRTGERFPYLEQVESPYDMSSADYLNITLFSWEELRDQFCQNLYLLSLKEKNKEDASALQDFSTEEDVLPYDSAKTLKENLAERLDIIEREDGGYVKTVRLGDYQMSGEEFREMFGLPSSDFYVDVVETQGENVDTGEGKEENVENAAGEGKKAVETTGEKGNQEMLIKEKRIRIVTRGEGHGFGMSRYGAEVLAEEGKTGEEILKIYFPKLVLEEGF